MADEEEARLALFDAIVRLASNPRVSAVNVRDLAEAFAYTTRPDQPHGGGTGGPR